MSSYSLGYMGDVEQSTVCVPIYLGWETLLHPVVSREQFRVFANICGGIGNEMDTRNHPRAKRSEWNPNISPSYVLGNEIRELVSRCCKTLSAEHFHRYECHWKADAHPRLCLHLGWSGMEMLVCATSGDTGSKTVKDA